jgi:hypothetical protein
MHLWIPLAILVPGRTRRADDRRVDDRALGDLDAGPTQVDVDRRQQRLAQLVALQQVPDLQTVVSSGAPSTPRSMPTKLRIATESYNASSTAGSDRLNHNCRY